MVPTWKTKKGKTSEFLDAGGYNRNESGELATWNGSTERGGERKFTLGTERYENIKNLYVNKKNIISSMCLVLSKNAHR